MYNLLYIYILINIGSKNITNAIDVNIDIITTSDKKSPPPSPSAKYTADVLATS